MKLEDFVKSLKAGDYWKLETPDKRIALESTRVLEIWRNAEGVYSFELAGYKNYEVAETADELLNYILANYGGKWLEYDFEIYKTRAELKAEIAALKEKLEKVRKEYEGVWHALTK